MPRRWLPTHPPPLSAGIAAAAVLVTVETLLLFPLAEVAAPVSLGVATSLVGALAFNFFHIPPTGRADRRRG